MSCERFDSVLEMEQCKSIVEILTSFCIHNLRALIFLLSPLILAQGVPRQSLRKRQCDISSGHNDFFLQNQNIFHNIFLLLMISIFIYCLLQSNKLNLNGPDNDFSILKKYKLQFFCDV